MTNFCNKKEGTQIKEGDDRDGGGSPRRGQKSVTSGGKKRKGKK